MDEVILEGKKFISARKAAEMSGYEQDYVGQLARMGRVLARQIGRTWYIEEQSLLGHKTGGRSRKRRLIASVQEAGEGADMIKASEPTAIALPAKQTSGPFSENSERPAAEEKSHAAETPSSPQPKRGFELTPVSASDADFATSIPVRNSLASSSVTANTVDTRTHELMTYIVDDGISGIMPVIHGTSIVEIGKTPVSLEGKNADSSVEPGIERTQLAPAHPPRLITALLAIVAISASALSTSLLRDERSFSRTGEQFSMTHSYTFRAAPDGAKDDLNIAAISEAIRRIF